MIARNICIVVLLALLGQLTIFHWDNAAWQVNAVSVERRTTSRTQLQSRSHAKLKPCTQVDHTVEKLEDPNLKCLEDYVQSPTTTCPANSQKTVVIGYLFGSDSVCKESPNLHPPAPLCYIEGQLDGPTYKDQPVSGVNSKRKNGKSGPVVACNGTMSPSQALRNAKSAIDNRMIYAQCGPHAIWQGFRMDCVGLVTRAWNLNIWAAFTVISLKDKDITKPIDCWDAHPGDIVTSGDAHVALIHHWEARDSKDAANSYFVTWEAEGSTQGHTTGSRKMSDIINSKGKSQCWRYKCMSDAVEIPPSMFTQIKSAVSSGLSSFANMFWKPTNT